MAMESLALAHMDFDALGSPPAWQVELGATEALGDVPVNAYDLPEEAPVMAALARPGAKTASGPAAVAGARPPLPDPVVPADPVALAHAAVAGADDLAGLRRAL